MADSNPTITREFQERIRRRFWVRVRPAESGCWLWTGGTRDNGYGTFAIRVNGGRWTQTTAHRFAYEDQVGPIPLGYEADHLCRVRGCVRDDHLEAVTVAENRRRRDLKIVFDVPRDFKPLPVIPPKPSPPPKRDTAIVCKNGHDIRIVGRVKNGRTLTTCAACRSAQYQKRRKGNYASTRTHCPQGHPYSGENLWLRRKVKNGHPYNARECRTCIRERNRLAYNARAA